VLDGAKAFALPTKFGQHLTVDETTDEHIHWISYDSDRSIWFEDTLSFSAISNKEKNEVDSAIKNTLIEILHEAYRMNPEFISKGKGYHIKTQLTFPKNWGLGTTSTLINNIGQWLQIDAYELLKISFGGSGYDIACAQNNTGIIYQLIADKPTVEVVHFNPSFADKLYFIYLNKKQNSREAIAAYHRNNANVHKAIPTINALTKTIVEADTVKDFAHAIAQHEIALSNILELTTIQETLFPDFDGVIKSLGAWGGDFVMCISKENPIEYFHSKGFEVVVPYHEMIL
jgi:mevalonate kinase